MKILAIDTTSQACSVALETDHQVFESYAVVPRQHANVVLNMLEEICQTHQVKLSDVDALAICHGPGAFTGLRIGCSVGQALAFAANIPIIPVSSLCALAQGAFRLHQVKKIMPMIDARMQEVYWGKYEINDQGVAESLVADSLLVPDEFTREPDFFAVGDGWQGTKNQPFYPHAQDLLPFAKTQFAQGVFLDAQSLEPLYIRNNVINR